MTQKSRKSRNQRKTKQKSRKHHEKIKKSGEGGDGGEGGEGGGEGGGVQHPEVVELHAVVAAEDEDLVAARLGRPQKDSRAGKSYSINA